MLLSARSRVPPRAWLCLQLGFIALLTLYLFRDGLRELLYQWQRPEFSHSFVIPVLALLIAAQRWERAPVVDPKWRWCGTALVACAMALFLLGEMSTLFPLIQLALVLCVTGFVAAAVGGRGTLSLAPALIYFAFMLPVPNFFLVQISSALQLVSTRIGVALVELFAIPVFADGNIIDLGVYKLQVAEACSGLRYLFPLMSFGFLVAYLYRGPFWQRALIFLSAIPITVLMNSLRIGVIGVTVDRFGVAAAEGFVHLFEGWTIFILCLALLLGEVALLARLAGAGGGLRGALALDFPRLSQLQFERFRAPGRARLTPVLAGALLLCATCAGAAFLDRRGETVPAHKPFATFPARIAEWSGHALPIAPAILDRLRLDDYLQFDYMREAGTQVVNLYTAYYASQRKGEAIHSPHNCLPGGGWEIESLRTVRLDVPGPDGEPLKVNRALIRKGNSAMIAYYWFQQRGRVLTSEIAVKWFILQDSIVRHRTDGAVIRLITPLGEEEDEARADARLTQFARASTPLLEAYIPQ